MEILDFDALGSISLEKLKMEGSIYYYDSFYGKCLPFNNIIVPNPIETGLVCSITSFRDNIVNAGTGDTLTIIGLNFEMPGQVEFPNADDGGASFTSTQPADIISWSNDTIKVIVPSNPEPAGYGIFRVRTSSGMLCPSPDTLDICYAVRNQRNSSTGVGERIHLGSSLGDNKYTFRPDSTLGNNVMAVASIKQALCDWNKATTINWELGAISNSDSPLLDSINHIFMATPDVLPIGAVATTIITRLSCQTVTTPVQLIPYSGDIDIAIRQDLTTLPVPITGGWNFDHTSAPAANQYDFYTIILHELGHAHNLKHMMPFPKAMFWASNAGDTLRGLSSKDILGAQEVFNTSSIALNQSFLCNPIDTASLCGTTSIIELDRIGQIKIFPNPLTESLTIELDLIQGGDLYAQIVDITGKQIIFENLGKTFSGHQTFTIELPNNISRGIYFLSLKFDDRVHSVKLLKI